MILVQGAIFFIFLLGGFMSEEFPSWGDYVWLDNSNLEEDNWSNGFPISLPGVYNEYICGYI